MSKLFVRLVASSAVAVGMSATALASGASIDTTGPGSTNVVTSSSHNRFGMNVFNRTDLGNWNTQFARSGNVWVGGNTKVLGFGGGSGMAFNINRGNNSVNIDNSGGGHQLFFGGSGNKGNASIFLTGPNSFNRISSNNSNQFTQNTNNVVRTTNSNNQSARSGDVVISGNTVVSGVGGSGNAFNENTGSNTVDVSNSQPLVNGFSGNGGFGGAAISTTGPGSFNQISGSNSNKVFENTSNDVSASNVSRQSAQSGNVIITGNTVVRGVGGSGDAANSNMGMNDVGISNN